MDLIHQIPVRIFGYLFLFTLFFMRGPLPNPFFSFWLGKTAFNRWVTAARFCIDWAVFLGMSENFVDYKIIALYPDGSEKIYWLRRDTEIGPVQFRSDLTRLVLSFYFDRWPFLAENLKKKLQDDCDQHHQKLLKFEIVKCLFSSFAPPEIIQSRSQPISSESVFNWRDST